MKIQIINRWSGNVIVEGDYISVKECVVKNSDTNFRDANLGGADLGGANLRGADLGGADLRGVNLRGADLRVKYPTINSHDFIAEILKREAHKDLNKLK